MFREIYAIQVEPDGMEIDPSTVAVSEIRGNQEYAGQRVRFAGEEIELTGTAEE